MNYGVCVCYDGSNVQSLRQGENLLINVSSEMGQDRIYETRSMILIIFTVLLVGMISGCGNQSSSSDNDSSKSSTQSNKSSNQNSTNTTPTTNETQSKL